MCDHVIDAPDCACGGRMRVANVPYAFVCMNCDGLQPQEVGRNPRPRSKTPQDHAYASEMRRREKHWYPSQFGVENKKKG